MFQSLSKTSIVRMRHIFLRRLTTTQVKEKAQEVSAQAQKYINTGSQVGGKTLTSILYNARVAFEFARLVAIREQFTLPTPNQWSQVKTALNPVKNCFTRLASSASNPSKLGQEVANESQSVVTAFRRADPLTGKCILKGCVTAVELFGLFCLGEIIGRRNLVGYNVESSSHSGHH